MITLLPHQLHTLPFLRGSRDSRDVGAGAGGGQIVAGVTSFFGQVRTRVPSRFFERF